MESFSLIFLISVLMSFFSIFFSVLIFKKVLQEDYKKPWLYIGISAIFFGISQLINFLKDFLNFQIISNTVTLIFISVLEFLSISFMAYGLFLEHLILKYYKGKFIKIKLIPVQEGNLNGDLDLPVSNGNSYLLEGKDRPYIFEQFYDASQKGFEVFLMSEENPKTLRTKYKIEKSPLLWINQIQENISSDYLKDSLDQNSEMLDPIHLNNLISFIDNFLEQSKNPFILIELNLILRNNSPLIVFEFLNYIINRIKKYNGILLCALNEDVLSNEDLHSLKNILKELD